MNGFTRRPSSPGWADFGIIGGAPYSAPMLATRTHPDRKIAPMRRIISLPQVLFWLLLLAYPSRRRHCEMSALPHDIRVAAVHVQNQGFSDSIATISPSLDLDSTPYPPSRPEV